MGSRQNKKSKYNDICAKKSISIEYCTQRKWNSIMDLCTEALIHEVTALVITFLNPTIGTLVKRKKSPQKIGDH